MIQMTKALWPLLLVVMLTAYNSSGPHHKTAMPDPATYNAHFGDMDTDQDDQVTREEFKAYFPEADMNVFEVIDLDHFPRDVDAISVQEIPTKILPVIRQLKRGANRIRSFQLRWRSWFIKELEYQSTDRIRTPPAVVD